LRSPGSSCAQWSHSDVPVQVGSEFGAPRRSGHTEQYFTIVKACPVAATAQCSTAIGILLLGVLAVAVLAVARLVVGALWTLHGLSGNVTSSGL
ncbi:hypothetical protein, partial [Streptomyces chiangmaiensis]